MLAEKQITFFNFPKLDENGKWKVSIVRDGKVLKSGSYCSKSYATKKIVLWRGLFWGKG